MLEGTRAGWWVWTGTPALDSPATGRRVTHQSHAVSAANSQVGRRKQMLKTSISTSYFLLLMDITALYLMRLITI